MISVLGRSYLVSEFSVENLFFVDRIEVFKRHGQECEQLLLTSTEACARHEQQAVLAEARQIYDDFIQSGSSYELNLPSKTVRELRTLFGDVTITWDALRNKTTGNCAAQMPSSSISDVVEWSTFPSAFDDALRDILFLLRLVFSKLVLQIQFA